MQNISDSALSNGSYFVDRINSSRVEQDALSQRSLSRINVRGDTNVAELAWVIERLGSQAASHCRLHDPTARQQGG